MSSHTLNRNIYIFCDIFHILRLQVDSGTNKLRIEFLLTLCKYLIFIFVYLVSRQLNFLWTLTYLLARNLTLLTQILQFLTKRLRYRSLCILKTWYEFGLFSSLLGILHLTFLPQTHFLFLIPLFTIYFTRIRLMHLRINKWLLRKHTTGIVI